MNNFKDSIALTNTVYQNLCQYKVVELHNHINKINEILDLRHCDGEKLSLLFTGVPFCFTEKDYNLVAEICLKIDTLIERIASNWFNNITEIRDFIPISVSLSRLIYKQHTTWQTYSRYDFILDNQGKIKINEFNAASPGALLTWGELNKSVSNYFRNSNISIINCITQAIENPNACVEIITEIEKQAKIKPETIAILYDNHHMLFELYEFRKRFIASGRNAIVAHVSECHYRNGKLYLHNEKISTVLNNFFIVGENLNLHKLGPWQQLDLDDKNHPYHDFCMAVLENKVLLTHGFAALALIEDKRMFTILSSDRFAHLFTSEEKDFLKNYIPLTVDNHMSASDKENILTNKDNYIFKTALSGGGLGTKIGHDMSILEWKNLIEETKIPFIIQERIIPMKLPIIIPTKHGINQSLVLNNCMTFYNVQGKLWGCASRLSKANIVNATSKQHEVFSQPVLVGKS